MPNAAEMNVMWGPVDSMLAAVNKNGQDARRLLLRKLRPQLFRP